MATEKELINDLLDEDEEDQEAPTEERPWFKCTFTDKEVIVESGQWEKINARALERAVRAVRRHRNIQRKLYMRAARLKEGLHGGRQG